MTLDYREPRLDDGARIHRMVLEAGTLDVNSAYLYFLLSDHFRETCVVAESDSVPHELLGGFLTAYRLPRAPDTLFIWQVAVHPDWRGRGVASGLLDALTRRTWFDDISRIELTISPDNTASQALFRRWAARLERPLTVSPYLSSELLNSGQDTGHQPEDLYSIDLR
ncbi:MAG: diaminobutyrate acetyltransferase [Halothiobacillus sp. 14-56-357]|jgi:L-2,4-diaminobutyric acid acetyltransferase|uniref:diaminobutyrate acetyltransferase n=1 Tax=Halothiobacillus sp. 15-55-196 TaxID=1970382 RepID=UPI000BDA9825|nr:diaminobutyrate acetyltransferase [Halothiobacillus sp. 15-55-196]OZB35949.1 MAG: diaminobutyrate acetyltransferase [Halothiobacillus sp. 15-55-196]OZB57518.1 MAG: diaminobutyrate acetyltransferase [Halothiobacillus sp. 14-56-357]OZB79373.1 MAG: diaminobutyrate acetyltransferase [Halothiobacillus sp. 13-55-115]